MQIIIDGEMFTGSPENLKAVMDARGYHAERNRQNPHPYWQWSEYIKKKERK